MSDSNSKMLAITIQRNDNYTLRQYRSIFYNYLSASVLRGADKRAQGLDT